MDSIDGVYRVDLLGPFGWESFSTAFIDGGEFRSASASHFTSGTCVVEDDGFEMEGNLTQYDDSRVLFGRSEVRGLPITFNGVIRDGVIDGEARPDDDEGPALRFRLARLPVLN